MQYHGQLLSHHLSTPLLIIAMDLHDADLEPDRAERLAQAIQRIENVISALQKGELLDPIPGMEDADIPGMKRITR